MRARVPVLLACAILAAGCGDDEKSGSGGTIEAPLEDREAVEAVFDGYNQALVDRDFDKACAALAASTVEKLKQNVGRLARKVDTCQQALEATYGAPRTDTDLLDEIARNARLTNVTISGDEATLEWTTKAHGTDVNQTQKAEKVGEGWKLVDVRTLGR